MSQPRLNNLMLLYIHKDRMGEINENSIATCFIMENERRRHFLKTCTHNIVFVATILFYKIMISSCGVHTQSNNIMCPSKFLRL